MAGQFLDRCGGSIQAGSRKIPQDAKEQIMNEAAVSAPVRKSVRVKAPIAHAFEVFTSGLTRWWPYDHGVGKKPIEKVLMEPRLGGRWLEIAEDGTETTVATVTGLETPPPPLLPWHIQPPP